MNEQLREEKGRLLVGDGLQHKKETAASMGRR